MSHRFFIFWLALGFTTTAGALSGPIPEVRYIDDLVLHFKASSNSLQGKQIADIKKMIHEAEKHCASYPTYAYLSVEEVTPGPVPAITPRVSNILRLVASTSFPPKQAFGSTLSPIGDRQEHFGLKVHDVILELWCYPSQEPR